MLVKDLLSPKQVARAIGVSESSLKRWCDQGLIRTERTAGGHRRLPVQAVLEFLRGQGYELRQPELLGLPVTSGHTSWTIERARQQLIDAICRGDELHSRAIVLDIYLAGQKLSTLCDHVLAAAFHEIGNKWDCGAVEVFEERRACEICHRLVHELRSLLRPLNERAPLAMGGTLDGDPYTLASGMVELVLRDVGWQAMSLGNRLPFATLHAALKKHRPRLLWLSVSVVRHQEQFIDEMNLLFDAAQAQHTALTIGGRALTAELRRRIRYTAFCDTLEHLEAFSMSLMNSSGQTSTETI